MAEGVSSEPSLCLSPDVELVQKKGNIGYLQSLVNHKSSKFWHWLYLQLD
jgi:hypothetical protein